MPVTPPLWPRSASPGARCLRRGRRDGRRLRRRRPRRRPRRCRPGCRRRASCPGAMGASRANSMRSPPRAMTPGSTRSSPCRARSHWDWLVRPAMPSPPPEQPAGLRSGDVAAADRRSRPAPPAGRHGAARFPRRRHRRGERVLAPVRGRRLCRHARDGAFGNFRTLLENISTNVAMGYYLTFGGNRKANARPARCRTRTTRAR